MQFWHLQHLTYFYPTAFVFKLWNYSVLTSVAMVLAISQFKLKPITVGPENNWLCSYLQLCSWFEPPLHFTSCSLLLLDLQWLLTPVYNIAPQPNHFPLPIPITTTHTSVPTMMEGWLSMSDYDQPSAAAFVFADMHYGHHHTNHSNLYRWAMQPSLTSHRSVSSSPAPQYSMMSHLLGHPEPYWLLCFCCLPDHLLYTTNWWPHMLCHPQCPLQLWHNHSLCLFHKHNCKGPHHNPPLNIMMWKCWTHIPLKAA